MTDACQKNKDAKYQTVTVQLDASLRVLIKNRGPVTYGMVVSSEIELDECGAFFDNFEALIVTSIAGSRR